MMSPTWINGIEDSSVLDNRRVIGRLPLTPRFPSLDPLLQAPFRRDSLRAADGILTGSLPRI
jgi:hypothetical protein